MSATTYIDEATLREPVGWDGVLDLEPLERKVGDPITLYRANDGSIWVGTMTTRTCTYVRREESR